MSADVELESPFLVTPLPGFTPCIGHLVCMMTYTRSTTLRAVQGLEVEQLDHLLDEEANSIGMLLEHVACIEGLFQLETFDLDDEDGQAERMLMGATLGAPAREQIRGHALGHYIERLEQVRARTLEELALRDDAWLIEERGQWNGAVSNNDFTWFHVVEDELNHRGQIRLQRKRLPGGFA